MVDVEQLKIRIAPDTDTDEVLEDTLATAGAMILNKMYPFGYPEGQVVPTRYEMLQLQLAAELFTQRGADGQSSHMENGITRTWPATNRILAQIIPHVGSVISNA